MSIILGTRSLGRLEGVHPDLVRVVKKCAALSAMDFTVLEGVRTVDQMYVNYGKGRTAAQLTAKGVPAKYARPTDVKVTWLSNPLMSNHRRRADGFGQAVDLAPWPINWNDSPAFQKLALTMFAAASSEKVHIRWGRDWDEDGRYEEKGETDGPHFELVGYPA